MVHPHNRISCRHVGGFCRRLQRGQTMRTFGYVRYAGQERTNVVRSNILAWKIPWTEEPVGCSPWSREELDTTERLHFHFSPSCIGEGNGNPLQCSCLENPKDGGAWWAAVYGVAQSRTRLKRLSSSSSMDISSIDSSDSWRQKAGGWAPWAGGAGWAGGCLMGTESRSAEMN